MRRFEYGTIGERDSDWVIIVLSVKDVGVVEDEVARGAGVGKGVLCCERRRCVRQLAGVVLVVFLVVVGEEGKTILVSKASRRGGGRLVITRTIITLINSYCVCVYSRPDLSGLVGLRVRGHDCFVNASFGG